MFSRDSDGDSGTNIDNNTDTDTDTDSLTLTPNQALAAQCVQMVVRSINHH